MRKSLLLSILFFAGILPVLYANRPATDKAELEKEKIVTKKKKGKKNKAVKKAVKPKLIKPRSDFAANKGKLLWPAEGVISIPFGIYPIEGTRIKGKSPGITIATPATGTLVKAVFDGVVADVDNSGDVSIVSIRHGKYYTIYSNLSAIKVLKGATVKTGQVIGKVGDSFENSGGELNFLLMIESKNVNPQEWLCH